MLPSSFLDRQYKADQPPVNMSFVWIVPSRPLLDGAAGDVAEVQRPVVGFKDGLGSGEVIHAFLLQRGRWCWDGIVSGSRERQQVWRVKTGQAAEGGLQAGAAEPHPEPKFDPCPAGDIPHAAAARPAGNTTPPTNSSAGHTNR